MIQKKVCMVGAFAVGKTSLVARFVHSIFSDKYLSTVGVKIDKKIVKVGDKNLMLIIWDLAGEDEFQSLSLTYLRGASGIFYVADGTRQSTLDAAFTLRDKVKETVGNLPSILALNKHDLTHEWEIPKKVDESLKERGWLTFRTSAKTGEGVEKCFQALAKMLVKP